MIWIKNTLTRYSEKNKSSKIKVCITSRGFHSCIIYRVSNILYKKNIPIVPMLLTRIIQILYSIDIDYKAEIGEGLVIYHGTGLVIGSKCKVGKNVTVFHNVTLGRSFGKNDGMPIIGDNTFIGTGASILGKVEKSFKNNNCTISGNPAKY